MTNTTQKPLDKPAGIKVPELLALTLIKVDFALTVGYSGPSNSAPDFAMDFGIACRRGEKGTRRSVFVEVTIRPSDEAKPVPFTGKIAACATLGEFASELAEEKIDEMGANYGAPIAYSMVRDEYLRLTGMTHFTRLLLPMVPRDQLILGTTYQDEDGNFLRQVNTDSPPS